MLREQGWGGRQHDASLQSLAVMWVWQGRRVYFHRFINMLLSIHTHPLACTALSTNLWQAWITVVEVDRLDAAIAAAVLLVFPSQMVP